MDKRVIDLIRTQIPEPNLSVSENPLVLFLEEMEAAFATLADDLAPPVTTDPDPVVESVVVQYNGSSTPPTLNDSNSPATFTADVTYEATVGTGAVTWSVTDITGGGTATIDSNGEVTFSGVTGFTVVAVSAENTSISGSLAVTVAAAPAPEVIVTGVGLRRGVEPAVDETVTDDASPMTFTAEVTYDDEEGTSAVTWSIAGDGDAVVVDGVVTFAGDQEFTLTATSVEDANFSASVTITVDNNG